MQKALRSERLLFWRRGWPSQLMQCMIGGVRDADYNRMRTARWNDAAIMERFADGEMDSFCAGRKDRFRYVGGRYHRGSYRRHVRRREAKRRDAEALRRW